MKSSAPNLALQGTRRKRRAFEHGTDQDIQPGSFLDEPVRLKL
jgi:hypothetical protein